MKKNIVTIQGFSFSYDQKKVLDQITCFIDEGDYVSIIGPNGAGKSTLLKCLNRILTSQEGEIHLFGQKLSGYKQKELGRLIGYVPQGREQLFPYTVYEFVMMGRYAYVPAFSYTTAEDHRAVEQALSMTGIMDLAKRPVNALSGGERQKVYLAGALAQEPKILLLDEPTTHLDPKHQVEIQKMIWDISSQCGMTVIHVTHDLQHLCLGPQKILALKEGRLIFSGPSEEILTPANLKTIFGTAFVFLPFPSSGKKFIVAEAML